MMEHQELLEKAKEAVGKVFSDSSVSWRETKKSLKEITDEIDLYLDTLNK